MDRQPVASCARVPVCSCARVPVGVHIESMDSGQEG